MFIRRINEESYQAYKRFISSNLEIYNLFTNGAYDVYYELAKDQSVMYYYAVLKKEYKTFEMYKDYIRFMVSRNGELLKRSGSSFSSNEELAIISFVTYIYELEKAQQNRFDLYPEIKEELEISSTLTLEQLKRRSELRNNLTDIINKHKDDKTAVSIKQDVKADKLYSLEFVFHIADSFQSDDVQTIGVSFKFNNGQRSYVVNDVADFLEAYNTNSTYNKGKSVNHLSYSAFKNCYGDAINYLLMAQKYEYYYYIGDVIFIDVEHAALMMKALLGETVTLDYLHINICSSREILIKNATSEIRSGDYRDNFRDYIIDREVTQASISLNADGSISLNPDCSNVTFQNILVANNFVIKISTDKNKISILDFENDYIKDLYLFFAQNAQKKLEFEYVKDIFQKQVLPKISSSLIKAAPINKEEGFKILLQISLDDHEYLHFKTSYDADGEILTDKAIEANAYYYAIKTSYLKILESVGGLENGTIKDGKAINTFITADLSELKKIAIIYLDEKLKSLNVSKEVNIKIKIESNMDWLGVSMHSDKYSEDELREILSAYRKKKKFVILNNNYIVLDEEKMQSVAEIADEVFEGDDLENEKVPFFQALKLKALEKDNITIDLGEYVQKAINDITKFKDYDISKLLKPAFKKNLRDYQFEAVKWMRVLSNNHLSGILADDMGLGKSLETIAFISTLKEQKPILIICPKSLIYNWDSEFSKWDDSYKRYVVDGSKGERKKIISKIKNDAKRVYITSYDSMRNDQDLYDDKDFSLVVIDEAQFIKNSETKKSKAVKTLHSDYRFALTGTPIENSLSDLWSIFDFLMPGYFESEDKFMKQYEDDQDKENLKKRVLPFVLRRTKEAVLASLPPKEELSVLVNMSDKQRGIYESYLFEAQEMIKKEGKAGVSLFGMMTRLRQICIDPSTFIENYDEVPPKLSLALQTIEESIYGNHKVLIFSSFTKVLDHLRYILDSKNIKSFYIYGETPASLRISMSEDFNNKDDTKIMLVSLKAGGTGLNLYGADTVIHLDPWWNIAAENQATDRAHRIGQTRKVTVYKFVNHDSIEEKVIQLQNMKKDLVKQVITNGSEDMSKMTLEDINFILGMSQKK